MLTVAKFGGSSLADGECFAAVKDILFADPARKGVVVSAPGKRHPEDPKITDLLYLCHSLHLSGGGWEKIFDCIAHRFLEIAAFCGAEGIGEELDALRRLVAQGVTREFLASRGEYFSARIMAEFLGWKFIDAADWLRFGENGQVDTAYSYGALWALADRPFVTPGFYGATKEGKICTFSRGGSDVTGAHAAAALEADLYENWTDVDGILQADPRRIREAKSVGYMTYGDLADLSLVGTQVLHEGAVRPVLSAGIPLHIRNTKAPEQAGTVITTVLPEGVERSTVLSLAFRRERALVSLSGGGLRIEDADFTASMLGRQTAAVPSARLEETLAALETEAGELLVQDGFALLAVVFAREAAHGPGAAELLAALKRENIPVEAILRPFGGHTLVLAVPDGLCDRALRALWRETEN